MGAGPGRVRNLATSSCGLHGRRATAGIRLTQVDLRQACIHRTTKDAGTADRGADGPQCPNRTAAHSSPVAAYDSQPAANAQPFGLRCATPTLVDRPLRGEHPATRQRDAGLRFARQHRTPVVRVLRRGILRVLSARGTHAMATEFGCRHSHRRGRCTHRERVHSLRCAARRGWGRRCRWLRGADDDRRPQREQSGRGPRSVQLRDARTVRPRDVHRPGRPGLARFSTDQPARTT
jgi:hypothetical protein